MRPLKIALDWTPNTNHTGFFVAHELGFYAENGIAVEILTPAADNYATTPAKKLELGQVDFAIAPFESVISLNTKANRLPAVAIAALLQKDISSIVTLANSNLTRPRELDNRTYASYNARYEDAIVRQMIINDGGTGTPNISYPRKLSIWDTLLTGTADATWIFDNWEGIEAETNGINLHKFSLTDYGIPYAYSPVIVSTHASVAQNTAAYKAFLRATKKGFQFAIQNPESAAEILSKQISGRDARVIDVLKSQIFTSEFYGDAAVWGTMTAGRVARFLDWLIAHNLESDEVKNLELFKNDLLQA